MLDEATFADACGNTFFIIDCLHRPFSSQEWEEFKEAIWEEFPEKRIDNVLVLRTIEDDAHAIKIKMHILDPYGTEADFCGNGARAVGAFLYSSYPDEERAFCLVSRRGEHRFFYIDQECFVEMGEPQLDPEGMDFTWGNQNYQFQFVDSIEPHLVTADFFDAEMLNTLGYEINLKWRKRFPEGVNLNCYRSLENNALEVLTFERGLYKITAACGTGSAACVQAAWKQKKIQVRSDVHIHVRGGKLKIYRIQETFWLGGAVQLGESDAG